MFGCATARRLPVLLTVLGLVAACATGAGTSPSASVAPSPSAIVPGPTPAAPATASPTSTVVPTAPPQVGLAWQRVADPDLISRPRDGRMYGVTAGGPGAIAWGSIYGAGPRIWTTVDGLDWRAASVEGASDAEQGYPADVLDVTAGGPGYVAVGGYSRAGGDGQTSIVWTSVDGLTWQRIPFGPVFERSGMSQVVAWKGEILAFGCENASAADCGPGRVWASPDGGTWARITPNLPEGLVSLRSVAPADDRLWGVGVSDPSGDMFSDYPRPPRVTSLDGRTWTTAPLPVLGIERLHPLPGGLYLTVEPSGDQPPAWVSRTPGVYRSTDLATWEPLAVGHQLGLEIIAVGGTLIMAGASDASDARAWRSTDGGRTWVAVQAAGTPPAKVTSASMSSVAALPNGTLVAVGAEQAGTQKSSTAAWVSPPVRP